MITPGEFVHHVRPEARALIASERPDEDAYLAMAATLLARVEPEPLWRPVRKRNGAGMGTVAYFPPVVLPRVGREAVRRGARAVPRRLGVAPLHSQEHCAWHGASTPLRVARGAAIRNAS